MKARLVVGIILYLAVNSFARVGVIEYGDVQTWQGDMMLERDMCFIKVNGWQSSMTVEYVEKALKHWKSKYNGLILYAAPCSPQDSARVLEAAGRLVPQKLPNGLVPTGDWQWDKPLVVVMDKTSSCDILTKLQERRWTEILSGEDRTEAKQHLRELIDRYKRERVDRLEDMFRK